jgi:phenylpyruvate tautomerase PptA (4-oxalocrotonate tautomerase family)
MPHLNVHLFEESLDGEVEPRLIAGLSEAMARVYGDWARAAAVVELHGVPRRRWGLGGRPAAEEAPVVTLNMREPALSIPGIDDPPARLIASVTDAMASVLGESVRPRVTTVVVGVPTGRSGVGGEPV